MPLLIGSVLALAVVAFARQVGFDRDRAFYPTLVIVVASYYVLFAVLSGSLRTILAESVVMAVFAGVAVAGFRSRPWIAVAALAGHGLFDVVHGHLLHNSGMPAWWPVFCGSFDLVAGAACMPSLRSPRPARGLSV
jgi:hypothetical protein